MKNILLFILLSLFLSSCASPIVTNQYDQASNTAIATAQSACLVAYHNSKSGMDVKDRTIEALINQLGGSAYNPCDISNSYDYAIEESKQTTERIKYYTELGGKAFEVTGKVILGKFIIDGVTEVSKGIGDSHTVSGDMIGGNKTTNSGLPLE